MRVAVLSSGGKDSTYAHWWATLQGWDVLALITCRITDVDSMMFQIPGTEIVKFQSMASNTAHLEFEISGEENKDVLELMRSINENMSPGRILQDLEGIVTGALKSDYQKSKIEMMCEELGVNSFSPLWHKNSNEYMEMLVRDNFEMLITSVSSDGLDEKWVGRILNPENLDELKMISNKYRFNIDGEGGEFETSVVNAPHFNSKIKWAGEKIWIKNRGYFQFKSLNIE